MKQGTPSRVMKGNSTDLTSVYSNLSIAKANAIILMSLTGRTSYVDINGKEQPIVINSVIDGKKRMKFGMRRTRNVNGKGIPALRFTVYALDRGYTRGIFIAIRIKSNMEKTQESQIVKNILKKYMRMFYRDCRMIFRKMDRYTYDCAENDRVLAVS